MNSDAKNLEAISKAIVQHNGNCEFPVLEIAMNPFEIERLGWEDFQGIPIVGDDKLPTGRFSLRCAGQHGSEPLGVATESAKAGEKVPIKVGERL